MEIIIIVIIIFVIMMFMGGMPTPLADFNMTADYQLAENQYYCQPIEWPVAPGVANAHFEGTVARECMIQGLAGVGIRGLRIYMEEQLPAAAYSVHEGPMVENFEGLPSLAYDMTLQLEAKKEQAHVRGMTHIATNGFTELRNVFVSTATPTRGAAQYLKGLRNEIHVESLQWQDWYRVRITSSPKVAKPWAISPAKFKEIMKQKTEEEFELKAQTILSQVASHL